MTSPFVNTAAGLVRAWTRVYTFGMLPAERAARLAEIESDLWECQQEGRQDTVMAATIVVRLAFGVVDDLVWRTTKDFAWQAPQRHGVTVIATAVLLTAAAGTAWWVSAVWPARLPIPPSTMAFVAAPSPPPPPPPPPPPCKPGTSPCECTTLDDPVLAPRCR